MLDGFTPWPPELAQRFRAAGYWEGLTLWGMVARTVARLPDKVALVAGERRETYADLDRASTRLGAALLRQGIRPLDRVVVQLPNTPEFVHWYLALVRIGAIPVLALRAHRHTEVRHFIRASGAVAYVVPDVAHHFDYRPMATQMQADFAGLRVFVVGEARRRPDRARRLAGWGRRRHRRGNRSDAGHGPVRALPTWPPCCCRAAPPRCPS